MIRRLPDRWLDAALLGCGGLLGVLVGFFSVVLVAARTPMNLGWITVLAMIGGLIGGLSAWLAYVFAVAGRSRPLRLGLLVGLSVLTAMAVHKASTTVLIR